MDDLEVRDLYAMLALCGMVANKGLDINAHMYAKISYKMADAMIKERNTVCEEEEEEEGIASVKKGRSK
jgi:hypothetical protein